MKQLVITLLLMIIHGCCIAQNNSQISGTWVLYKTTINNQQVIENEDEKFADTIIINNEKFEQRVWVKNEEPFREKGTITLKKGKIILTQRTTSIPSNEQAPDIYHEYKLKNETLIMGIAILLNKSEDSPVRFHYQKINATQR